MSKFLKVSGITVAVGVALYAGLGYFGVPYIARTVLERFGSTELARTVTVKDIRFNPWTWRFELEGLSVKSQEGTGYFLTLDELTLDASSATLTNLAPVIEEVTVKGLHGTLTWSDENLQETEKYAVKDESPSSKPEGGLPAFAVYNVNVSDTSLHFIDKKRGIDQKIEDFTLALPFVSTLPAERESLVTPKLSMTWNGTPIVATGSTKPFGQSLEAQLHLNVKKLDVAPILELVPSLRNAPVHLKKGWLSSDLTLVFRNPTGGNPAQMLVAGKMGLDDVLVEQRVAGKNALLLSAKALTVDAKEIDPIGRRIDVSSITLDTPKSRIVRDDGILTAFATATPTSGTASTLSADSKETTTDTPWVWSLGKVTLKNGSLAWHDASVQPTVDMTVSNLSAELLNLTSVQGATPSPFTLSARVLDGRTNLKGTIALSPLKATVSLSGEKLNFKQTAGYVKTATGLDVSGLVDFSVSARHDTDNTTAHGNLTMTRLLVKNRLDTLLSLQNAHVAVSDVNLAQKKVALDSVLLDTVMVNLRNTKSGFNIPGMTTSENPNKTDSQQGGKKGKAPTEATPWQWALGSATLRNTTLNYKDQTTSPQTAITVSKLNASAQKLSSEKGKLGDVSLSALVAGGAISVRGKAGLTPLQTQLTIETKNLQLAPFSPLARKFAGYGARSGTVNVSGNLSLHTPKETTTAHWTGDASLTKFDLVDQSNHSLATLNGLTLTGMDVDTTEPLRASVKTLVLDKPGTQETKRVEKVAEIASIFGALTGKKSVQKEAAKVNKVLNAKITLHDLRYENGRISAEGVDHDALARGIVDALNEALTKGDKTKALSESNTVRK